MSALNWTEIEPNVFTADDVANNWRYTIFEDDEDDQGGWVVETAPLHLALQMGSIQPAPWTDYLASGLPDQAVAVALVEGQRG